MKYHQNYVTMMAMSFRGFFMKNKLLLTAFVALMGLNSSAVAQEQNTQVSLSDDEVRAGICIIANQGIYTVASERQAGKDKVSTKKQLDKELKQLGKKFNDQQFLQGISDVWYHSLDRVYQLPVFETPEEKEAFVSIVTEEAFMSCINSLGS